MLGTSRAQIEARLDDNEVVLDVGAWASPWPRADWVLDLMPYETRGLYGELEPEAERFSARSWVERDICDHEPWPFEDDRFDFVVCSHTLEDVRDPVWVCHELNRVAKAGYIEVPSRLEEQSFGVHGPWVGWSHHHWLIDVSAESIQFVLKPHMLSGREEFFFPQEFGSRLTDSERVQTMFWEGGFEYRERIFYEPPEMDEYLASLVRARAPARGTRRAGGIRARLRELVPQRPG